MPPRLPHGLKKGPFHMNTSEKTVLGMLGCSIMAGFYTLATSPLYDKDTNTNTNTNTNKNTNSTDAENKKSLSSNHEDGFYADTTGEKDKAKAKAYLFKV
eukprot:979971_1